MQNLDTRGITFQTDFTADELAKRRERLTEKMGSGVALLQGVTVPAGFDAVRQNNEIYYLCGVEAPHAYLWIDAAADISRLYLRPRNEKEERNEGPSLSSDDVELARKLTGVSEVRPLSSLPEDLKGQKLLYLLHAGAEGRCMCRDTLSFMQRCVDADPLNRRPSAEANLIARVKDLCPDAEIRDLSPLIDGLRLVKSPAEVAVLRQAGRLSALAVTEAMRSTRPGVMEYQLGAIADYIYEINGARGPGYRAIIAGGSNIWLTHYFRNACVLSDGDLVLMDYAPDVNNYTSDIGRMWPVNGKYSPPQRELYGLIVEYHKTMLSLIRPGPTPEQIHLEAAAKMRPVIENWTFSKPAWRKAGFALLDFKGHLSHGVGMAVHEAASYYGKPLEPGRVFAVDPQLWVPEEKIYVRCEDTVAVTENGCEVLTAAAPLELDDIERTIAEKGMLQTYPAHPEPRPPFCKKVHMW
ncbi:MAG TPA: Xaa-Pro peptidase family protein [Planctomycetota bacterium]